MKDMKMHEEKHWSWLDFLFIVLAHGIARTLMLFMVRDLESAVWLGPSPSITSRPSW